MVGDEWNVHDISKYCSYSIYQQKEGDEAWTPLIAQIVNQVLGEEFEKKEETSAIYMGMIV
jgi:hypothetical protein